MKPDHVALAGILEQCHPIPWTGCHVWPKATTDSGHARGSVRGKVVRLNRLALACKLGRELLPHEHACHTCDVRACLNQDHLFVGSNADNVRDRTAKGRTSRHGRKLDVAGVRRLLRLRARMTVREVAAELGLSLCHVQRVCNGKRHAGVRA